MYQVAFYLRMPVPGMGKMQLTDTEFRQWFGGGALGRGG